MANIAGALAASGLRANRLVIEITEFICTVWLPQLLAEELLPP